MGKRVTATVGRTVVASRNSPYHAAINPARVSLSIFRSLFGHICRGASASSCSSGPFIDLDASKPGIGKATSRAAPTRRGATERRATVPSTQPRCRPRLLAAPAVVGVTSVRSEAVLPPRCGGARGWWGSVLQRCRHEAVHACSCFDHWRAAPSALTKPAFCSNLINHSKEVTESKK